MLYVVPEGRVAYWSNWTGLGLSKNQWGDIHITGGFLFLSACIIHSFINIKPIISYLRMKNSRSALPALISIILCTFIIGGTLAKWSPMSDVLQLSQALKKEHERVHGNPPYGHAEMSSLETFCRFMRMDVKAVASGLKNEGLKGTIDDSSTLKVIANANGIAPSELYKIILKVSGLTEEQVQKMTMPGRRNGEGKGKNE